MDSNSPLRFLDIDVSRMIYEKYYPPEKNKQMKNIVTDQFKYHRDNYLNEYKINNIYDISTLKYHHRYTYNNIQILKISEQNHFINYLLYKCKFRIIKKKIDYQNKKKSWKRAKSFKIEALKLKRNNLNL